MTTQQHRWILGGGLATGKSLVRAMLNETGIATIDADAIGHEVLEPAGVAFPDVASRWPEVVVDDVIDRRALARIVFSDRDELTALESITHPHIFDRIVTRMESVALPVVVEMPLITNRLDGDWRTLVVDSRDEVKLARARERGMPLPDAEARLAAQPSRATWLAVADLVIPNHGSVDELADAVRSAIPHL